LDGLNAPGAPSFAELVRSAVAGELNLTPQGVAESAARLFLNELWVNNRLIRQLLVVAVLSAVLRVLSDSFRHKSAGELGFYVSYIMMVLLAISSFRVVAGILFSAVTNLSGMMEAGTPVLIGLLAVSGKFAGSAALHPAMYFAIHFMSRFISVFFIPLVSAAAALTVVNHLTENAPLEKMTELLRTGAEWTLKGLAGLFILLLTLQRISVPIVNNFAMDTARAAAGAVPVVGGALNSALDTVLIVGTAARSGVLVAMVVALGAAAAVPVLKMLAIMLIYKLAAAVTQPICDKRFTACVDEIGSFMGLLAGAAALVAVMFIGAVAVVLMV
jgi:stage III sporulation protein AE